MASVIPATFDVTPLVEKVGIPIALAILSLLGGAWLAVYNRGSGSTDRRRASYAEAVRTLVAWSEYPYRVRRRRSDLPDELARLAGLGHDLQERLRCHQTWIVADSREVGEVWDRSYHGINALVGPACQHAWEAEPVTTASGMNLGDWGPGRHPARYIEALQTAISWRFSWPRRLTAPWRRLLRKTAAVQLLGDRRPMRTQSLSE